MADNEATVFDASNPITLESFRQKTQGQVDAFVAGKDIDLLEDSAPSDKTPEEDANSLLGIEDDFIKGPDVQEEGDEEGEFDTDTGVTPSEELYLDIGEYEGKKYRVELPDGKVLEIPEGAKIYNKIDGRVEPFALSEQMSVASGNVAISRRFNQLKVEKEALTAEKEALETSRRGFSGTIENFKRSLASEDPEAGIQGLAEALDMEPGTFIETILSASNILGTRILNQEILPRLAREGVDVSKITNPKTPEEAAFRDMVLRQASKEAFQQRNDLYRTRQASKIEEKRSQEIKTRQDVENYERSQYKALGLEEKDVQIALEVLKNVGELEPLKQETKGNPKELIDRIFEKAYDYRRIGDIRQVLNRVSKGLKDDNKFVSDVARLYVPGKHSMDDLETIIRSQIKLKTNSKTIKVAPTKKEVAQNVSKSYDKVVDKRQVFKSVDEIRKAFSNR